MPAELVVSRTCQDLEDPAFKVAAPHLHQFVSLVSSGRASLYQKGSFDSCHLLIV